ncbi:MAG: DUF542 domain-containing protein, partial [Flavisolibacter sp.]
MYENSPVINLSDSICDIVRSDYRTADVFNRYDISYCMDGRLSLKQVCQKKKIEPGQIISELHSVTRNIFLSNHISFSHWEPGFLVDYILNVHHSYLHRIMPQLESG